MHCFHIFFSSKDWLERETNIKQGPNPDPALADAREDDWVTLLYLNSALGDGEE